MGHRRGPALLCLPVFLAVSLAACQPTPEKISTWKGTQQGPKRLREVVQDQGADPKLRALAAAALFEIGSGQEAARDLAKAEPRLRAQTAHELIAPLTAMLGESASQPTPTTKLQRAGKDALFMIRGDAEPADRAAIDAALLKWTTADLAARAGQGGESTEKILRAIGPQAATALLPLVKPGPDLLLASQLIGELGDAETKAGASRSLIELVRRGGLSAVPTPLLVALGQIGGPEATALLLEIATKGSANTREHALVSLAQGQLSAGDARALEGALAIAADSKAPGEVRDAAFAVLEKLGPAAVGGILRSFADPNPEVRYRAIEAAFKAGGKEAVPRVLAALPESRPWKSEDLDSYVVHDLDLLGKDAQPALLALAQDRTKPALGRVAALRSLAHGGSAKQAAALGALVEESTIASALSPPARVGEEARRARDAAAARGN